MEIMLIQLDQLLQISAFVTTACKGDEGLVNVGVNGTMQSRSDFSESAGRAARSQQPDTISKAHNQNIGQKGLFA